MSPAHDTVVIWAVVSSDEQNAPNKTSIETQLDRCTRYCADAGDTVVAVLKPPDEAGFSRFYSRLDQMMAAYAPYRELVELIESGTVTKAVALNYSRYWRTSALATQLCAVAEESGVWLYSIEEPTSREGWMENAWLRMIYSTAPEEQVRQIAANRRRGMQGRAEKGLPVTSLRPYGYRLVGQQEDRLLVADELERDVVHMLMEWRADGWGAPRALRELERLGIPGKDGRPWTTDIIRYIWRNPTYAGWIRSRTWPRRPKTPRRGEPVVTMGRGQHEPIISEELWQRVQRINEAHRRDYSRNFGSPYLFSSLCQCGFCGGGMIYRRYHRGSRGLRCSTHHVSRGQECCYNGYSERRLRHSIVAWLRVALADPDSWLRQAEGPNLAEFRQQRIERLQREIATIDQRRRNLMAAIEMAIDAEGRAEMMERYNDLARQRAARLAEIESLEATDARLRAAREQLLSWAEAAADIEQWSDDELRPRLLQLIDRIVLRHGEQPVIILL